MKFLKSLFLYSLSIFLFISFMGAVQVTAQENIKDPKAQSSLAKTMSYDPEIFAMLNINNLTMWERQDGKSNHSPKGNDGVNYPRGTTNVIYQDGVVWGAEAYLDANHTQPAPYDQLIRVGGATYGTGCKDGWVIGEGANAVRVETDHPRARIYRIRRDWKETFKDVDGDWTQTAIQDAADVYEIAQSAVTDVELELLYSEFQWSWDNWPVDLGAPFIDRNGNGRYDPPPDLWTTRNLIENNWDEPGVAGLQHDSPADQVIWTVYNDLYRSLRFGSEPIGLEVQSTVWGYNRWDSMSNLYFRKIKIINKGGVEIDTLGNMGSFYLDSMYVCQFSDPDIGDGNADVVGCDTLLNLGFAYNFDAIDDQFQEFFLPPPSVGYVILQGPILPSSGDRAIFDMKYKYDFKNLGMTSFCYYGAGTAYSDPSNSTYATGAIRWYKMLRGFAPLDGPDVRYLFPPGVEPGLFLLAGDPVAGTGHIDGHGWDSGSFVPGDRKLLCNSGPFQLAPGETQEVVTALVCGLGADNLSSVSVMKYNDRFAQSAYDALFAVPKEPRSPIVNIKEMDGKVILEWGSDLERVNDIEKTESLVGGVKFEGYTVYQFPKYGSTLKEAKRIATFDLKTDPTVVLDEGFDETTGQILLLPVQYGSNSGIKREFVFERDYINDIDKIYNGSEYYLAVTAYSVASETNFVPRTLESYPRIFSVVPQSRGLGEVIGSDYGQVIEIVVHVNGSGSAKITPIVIEPYSLMPANYSISWDSDSTWKVEKDGTTLAEKQSNYSGDEDYPIIDGVKVKVEDVNFSTPIDFTNFTVNPENRIGNYKIDSYYANGWADNATSLEVRGFGTNDISLLQNDIELRFTGEYENDGVTIREGTGSIATFIGARNYNISEHPLNPNPGLDEPFIVRIPFEVWDVERDQQINLLVYDRIQNISSAPFYAFNPSDRMYCYLNSLPYQETALDTLDEQQNSWNLVFWKTDWQTGDVIRINYANPIIPGVDEFSYSTAGLEVVVDNDLKKKDIKRIGVFPNPYYAFNPLEVHQSFKFVTFNNLPPKVTIRIFNLAGHLVRKYEKNDDSKFLCWDLRNHNFYYVASGIYIAHIDMPEEGLSRVLKLVIVMETEFLPVY